MKRLEIHKKICIVERVFRYLIEGGLSRTQVREGKDEGKNEDGMNRRKENELKTE